MALDLKYLTNRLSSLTNTNKLGNIWKPKPGKQTVRIVPYKFSPENPFIELKFHYNINGKTYLSPDSFNRPDPIVEFSNNLKQTGDKEDWKLGRRYEPKMRTYVPIFVRGEESEGVKFWGFGKQVYQELLSIISDPDYGDITDLVNGRDVIVEFRTAAEANKQYPETNIRVKPNVSASVDPKKKDLVDLLKEQSNILDMFPELSYDELKEVMTAWLNSETTDSDSTHDSSGGPIVDNTESDDVNPSTDSVVSEFDQLFADTPTSK